jgi:acyl carrier protein
MNKKIIRFLSEIRPEFDFSESTNFIEDGMLDSFDIVQLVVSLDNEFGISIDGLDILPENFSSVKNIAELLIKNGVSK